MAQTVSGSSQCLTMEEYLAYDDGTDTRYELVNGELTVMPPESQVNASIAKFLFFELAKYLSLTLLSFKDTEIEVSGKRATCRLPDLMVHSEASRSALVGAKRATLTREMPPPALVVEIVSPGEDNRNRDYRYKHTEYAARGITEYWIIDPEPQQVTVCLWVEGKYEDRVYRGETPIQSTVVTEFNLSADQILAFGNH